MSDEFSKGATQQFSEWAMRDFFSDVSFERRPLELETDVELTAALDAAAGACWGLLPWVCGCQTVHGQLSAYDRIL